MSIPSLDLSTSFQIAVDIDAQPNACWSNAWDAVTFLPGAFTPGAYVEGWMVIETTTEIHLIEHGWAERAGHQVIDPTIVYLAGDVSTARYYAGHLVPWYRVLCAPDTVHLPLVRHWYRDEGLEHRGYLQAYRAARHDAEERSQRLHQPLLVYRMAVGPEN